MTSLCFLAWSPLEPMDIDVLFMFWRGTARLLLCMLYTLES